VSEAGPLLDRGLIEDAFRRLGDRLAGRGVVLGLTSVNQVLAVCARVFPDEPVPDRARLVLEDAFEAHE
jgi:hypothetical protein